MLDKVVRTIVVQHLFIGVDDEVAGDQELGQAFPLLQSEHQSTLFFAYFKLLLHLLGQDKLNNEFHLRLDDIVKGKSV